jgi:glutamate/tyrosine decarboxylase-like PLP-dependent enzyme
MSGHDADRQGRASLFPSREERRRHDGDLTRALSDAEAWLVGASVTPTFDVARFRRELAAFDFAAPRPLEDVVSWTIAQMEHGLVHITHPRYFGLFNPAPTFPAQCADRIAAVFNPQLATATTSPAPVAIEAHVIRAVGRRVGLPSHAVVMAANPRFATDGARAFAGPAVFYVSRDCHLAWLKIALMAGLGRSAVRLVATDGMGRMDGRALEQAIAADRASGDVPVMVVATAGTTNAGMIDPLADCAAAARRQGLWYHIDAAWGGALVASDRLRGVLAGLELANSVTIDAHKWFATTMGCGMFLTSEPQILSQTFQVSTSFMPSNDADLDPYVTTVQWSRRFLGLRLFLSLATAGWDGYAAHVERAIDLAAQAQRGLATRGWRAVNQSPLAVLCVVPPDRQGDARSLVRRVVGSGRAWVAAATFEGQDVVRICLTHGETSEDDVAALVDILDS